MSDKYKIANPESCYFLTLTIVGWIDVFTRKNQDGSEAKEIFSKDFFYEKLEYIHTNPIEEMIVSKPEDYLYSSARNYAGLSSLLDIVRESSKQVTYK